MKTRLIGCVGLSILVIVSFSSAIAQDQTLRSIAGDKWVISAKAGGVNFVQGMVNVSRKGGQTGLLIKGDSVEVGDRISTGADGRAEILLNPGSYLRMAENSTFEFKTTQLEDLQVLALKGSVMLEVFAANDFKVAVSTPKQTYDLIESGVYRIDVDAEGNGRIEVWKGKAEVGDAVLKGGRFSNLDGQVAKFDRDERDEFETWSRDRAKELAKSTNTLRDKTLRTTLMRSFIGGRWNMYNSFGLWVYDASFGRYCFLPFGYGWSSPYGYGFGTDIWWYRLPSVVYYPPSTLRRSVAGNPPVGGTPTTDTPTTSTPRQERRIVGSRKMDPEGGERREPPFVTMQGSGRGTGSDLGGFDPSGSRSGSSSGNGGFSRGVPGGVPASSAPMSAPRSEPASSGRGVGGIRGKGDPIN